MQLLILLSLKWLILRKSTIANYFKSSAYIYFVLVLVIFQFADFGFHLGNLLLGIFAGIMGVIELIAMFNQRNKFFEQQLAVGLQYRHYKYSFQCKLDSAKFRIGSASFHYHYQWRKSCLLSQFNC